MKASTVHQAHAEASTNHGDTEAFLVYRTPDQPRPRCVMFHTHREGFVLPGSAPPRALILTNLKSERRHVTARETRDSLSTWATTETAVPFPAIPIRSGTDIPLGSGWTTSPL